METPEISSALIPQAGPAAPEVATLTQTMPTPRRRVIKMIAGGVAVLALIYVGTMLWHSFHYESTDDAFIEGTVVQVSPHVSGHVVRVVVDDNQHVAAGDLLLEIDPRDYQVQLDQAKAALASAQARLNAAAAELARTRVAAAGDLAEQQGALEGAQAQVQSAQTHIAWAQSALVQTQARREAAQALAQQAQAEAARAAADLIRYQNIFKTGGITASQLDQYATAAAASRAAQTAAAAQAIEAQAGVNTAQEYLRQARADVGTAQGKAAEMRGKRQGVDTVEERIAKAQADRATAAADVDRAAAQLRQAELDLSYTKVYAAQAGVVTKKSVEVGDYVRTGQALLALVGDDKWVTANFKESQLAHMRPGQPVLVRVDAYPSLDLRGKVDSIQRGTGARFSLLPAENATGNYVKVVQRVPIKIIFDQPAPPDRPLALGMSVTPEVKVR